MPQMHCTRIRACSDAVRAVGWLAGWSGGPVVSRVGTGLRGQGQRQLPATRCAHQQVSSGHTRSTSGDRL